MNFLDFIPKSIFGIVIIFLLTTNFSCAWKNNQLQLEVSRTATRLAEVQKEHAEQVVAAVKERERVQTEYRAKEQALVASATKERKTYEEQIAAARNTADFWRVRPRPTASAVFAFHAGPPAVSARAAESPAGLGDSEAVSTPDPLDEALRAETIRLNLLSCYRQYDEVRDALGKQ